MLRIDSYHYGTDFQSNPFTIKGHDVMNQFFLFLSLKLSRFLQYIIIAPTQFSYMCNLMVAHYIIS